VGLIVTSEPKIVTKLGPLVIVVIISSPSGSDIRRFTSNVVYIFTTIGLPKGVHQGVDHIGGKFNSEFS